jgi:paraquat-inducible protein A
MLEVVMLGILVALTKIAELATVEPGIGMYAFGAAILLIPAILGKLDKHELWQKIAWNVEPLPQSPTFEGVVSGAPK